MAAQNSIVDRGNSWWFYVSTSASGSKISFLRFPVSGYFGTVGSNTSIQTGVYTHVVGIYDTSVANEVKLYINGVLDREASLDGPIKNITAAVTIGNRSGAHPFDGIIDDVRVSNIVRSAAWIKASYESGRNHFLDFGEEEAA